MEDFTFLNPTKIVFGRGRERDVGKLVKPFADKVLIVYGKGSIKRPVKNDGGGFAPSLYDRICSSLEKEGVKWTELPGVQPNPRLELVRKGIEICRKEKITFVLAPGGGERHRPCKGNSRGCPIQG
jgi:alcohol dehydrogenase YqhD (iron-dependent ADH family)